MVFKPNDQWDPIWWPLDRFPFTNFTLQSSQLHFLCYCRHQTPFTWNSINHLSCLSTPQRVLGILCGRRCTHIRGLHLTDHRALHILTIRIKSIRMYTVENLTIDSYLWVREVSTITPETFSCDDWCWKNSGGGHVIVSGTLHLHTI